MRKNNGTVTGPYRIWPWHYVMGDPISFCIPPEPGFPLLPLSLRGVEEPLEDADDLFQRFEVLAQLHLNLLLVRAELDIKVLAVGASAHGGAEDGLHKEAVMGLEGDTVGVAEGVGELGRLLGQVLAESDTGEFKGPAACR